MLELLVLLDTAGRLSRTDNGFSWLTAAAVGMPTATTEALRSHMASRPKWRSAELADIEAVLQILEQESLWVQTLRVHKSQPAWSRFWDEADSHHRALARRCRSRVSIAKADTQLRIFLLGETLASLVGRVLRHDPPRVLSSSGMYSLSVSIYSDDDIQANEGKRLFVEIWRGLAAGTRIKAAHGIEINIQEVSFRQEEREELLLLPDYLAGLVQVARAAGQVPTPPSLSDSKCKNLLRRLEAIPSYESEERPFDLEYSTIAA